MTSGGSLMCKRGAIADGAVLRVWGLAEGSPGGPSPPSHPLLNVSLKRPGKVKC